MTRDTRRATPSKSGKIGHMDKLPPGKTERNLHVGRPTIFTPEMGATICDAIRRGHHVQDAAALAGVSRPAVYVWIERGRAGEEPFASFVDDLARAEAESIDEVLPALRHPLGGKNAPQPTGPLSWLKLRGARRRREVAAAHHCGSGSLAGRAAVAPSRRRVGRGAGCAMDGHDEGGAMNDLSLSDPVPMVPPALDGGAICFVSGAVPPWELAPTPDTRFPVIVGFGLSSPDGSPEPRVAFGMTVDWPHVEALRFEGGYLYLRGETVAHDPALFGAVRAWLVALSLATWPGWRPERLRYTTGAGGRTNVPGAPDGKPGAIRFAAHHGAPAIVLSIDGAAVDGVEATPAEVHAALRAWFLGPQG